MCQELIAAFTHLLDGQLTPAETTEFLPRLDRGAFQHLAPFLDAGEPAAQKAYRALFRFVRDHSDFRLSLADYVLAGDFTGHPKRHCSTVLQLLGSYGTIVAGTARALEPKLYEAAARHRRWREPEEQPLSPGPQLRRVLQDQVPVIAKQPPEHFVPAFRAALATRWKEQDADLAGWPEYERAVYLKWEEVWRNSLWNVLCGQESIQRTSIESPVWGALQRALLEGWERQEYRERLAAALAGQLEEAIRRWSVRCTKLNLEFSLTAEADRASARLAEQAVLDTVAGMKPVMPDACAHYGQFLSLAGGWRQPKDQTDVDALPCWLQESRDAREGVAAYNLPVLPAVALEGFIRLKTKLWGGQVMSQLSSLAHLEREGTEVLGSARRLGLTTIDFRGNLLPGTAVGVSAADLFPLTAAPRDSAGPLHPDHRRALRIALAGFFLWRADMAYRNLGAKPVGELFREDDVTTVTRYYKEGARLLEEAGDGWLVGLGFFGRLLDAERASMQAEIGYRQGLLETGQDYLGDKVDWPNASETKLLAEVDAVLGQLESLGVLQNRSWEDSELGVEEQKAVVSEQRAGDLLDAAAENLAAQTAVVKGFEREAVMHRVRVGIAEHRLREVQFQKLAALAEREARADTVQAEKTLEAMEQEALKLLNSQVQVLKDAIEQLRTQLPELAGEIQSAQKSLGEFEQKAKQAWQDKHREEKDFWSQIGGSFGKILRAIGSAVSVYFTGVDLVKVADGAMAMRRSAEAGDWASAFGSGFDMLDTASKGKLKKLLETGIASAETYLSSTMTDVLGDAAAKIADVTKGPNGKPLLDVGDITRLATEVVGRQAVRIGLSTFAEKNKLQVLAGRLGLKPASEEEAKLQAALEPLAMEAKQRLVDAAHVGIEKCGQKALEKVLEKVKPTGESLENLLKDPDARRRALEAWLAQKGQEKAVVELIQQVRKEIPEADITAFKAALLDGKKKLVGALAQRIERPLGEVEAAVGQWLEESADVQGLSMRLPLPTEVQKGLLEFQGRVQSARQRLAPLASPAAQQSLVQQLSGSGDFPADLSKAVTQLNEGLAAAVDHFQGASQDLEALRNELAKLDHEEARQKYVEEIQNWRRKASEAAQKGGEALAAAAAEAALSAEQQKFVEELGLQAAEARLEAARREQVRREKEAAAAGKARQIEALDRERVRLGRARWLASNRMVDEVTYAGWAEKKAEWADYANRRLIQIWRLATVYRGGSESWGDYEPKYDFPTPDHLRKRRSDLEVRIVRWENSLPADYRVLSSIKLNLIEAQLNKEQTEKLRPFLTPDYPVQDCAVFEGPKGLQLLRAGVFLRLAPERAADLSGPGAVAEAALSVFLGPRDEGGTGRWRVLKWDDSSTYRARLLAVQFRLRHDVENTGDVSLAQLSDAWLRIPGKPGVLKIALPPFTPPPFKESELASPGWETRPLFGTYFLQVSDGFVAKADPPHFYAELHFVAVGIPAME